MLGSGGKQVFFGREDGDVLFGQRVREAVKSPFAVIGQPFVELSQLNLAFDDGAQESRVFDIRSVNLMLGGRENFEFLPTPMPTLRVARNKALRVNISGGGAVSLAIPTGGESIWLLQKLAEKDPSFEFASDCIAEVLQAAPSQVLRTAL